MVARREEKSQVARILLLMVALWLDRWLLHYAGAPPRYNHASVGEDDWLAFLLLLLSLEYQRLHIENVPPWENPRAFSYTT